MIRKMLAMLVAISCAFGAWADTHISGTDFSGLTAGPFVLGLDDYGNDTGTNYWYSGDGSDFEGTIVADASGKKFLDFESNITNPLYRTINNCDGATSPSQLQATSIGTGLFIDTHVQFTPYLVNENHPAPSALSNDDKLIVWVRETEVDGDANITNLIVTAGYYDAFDAVSASNYVVRLSSAQVSELCSHTNRLTIKSFSCITDTANGPVGFVIYLNEQPIEYDADAFAVGCSYVDDLAATPGSYYEYGHHMLFLSLMGNRTNYDKLIGIGYAGMGKIGDVIFDNKNTDFPPFAADANDFRVVPGDGVESYVYNNVEYTTEQAFSVPATVATVTISNVQYATGWQHKEGTWYNGTTIVANEYDAVTDTDSGTFVLANGATLNIAGFQANYTVGGVQYQTLFGGSVTEPTGAFAAAKNGGTIVLNSDIIIAEGVNEQIVVGEGDELTIDLNGHTIQGTAADGTIVNEGGTLTIVDNSVGQTGKVLGCLVANPDYDSEDPDSEPLINNYQALLITEEAVATTLDAGTYEFITKDELNNSLVISNGAYLCVNEDEPGEQPESFYLVLSLATGATYSWSQDPDTDLWYAIVTSGSGPTPPQPYYFPQTSIEEEWADRDGTAAKPFVIRNLADFNGLWNDIADGYNTDKCFEVVSNNITLTDWVGIGTNSSTYAFAGTLNGNGNTVNVGLASGKYRGLFGYINGATIENLTVNVTGVTVSGSTGGAAFVGNAYGVNVLTAIKATGSLGTAVNRITHNAGGLVAYAIGPSASITYNSCTNAMDVYSTYTKLGGFLGWTSGGVTVTINNGVNLGNLDSNSTDSSGNNGTGGLIGWDGTGAGVTINGATSLGTVEMGTGNAGSFYGSRSSDVTFTGVLKGHASEMPIGGLLPQYQLHSLDWATVDGDVATFVTPVATVDSVVAYKVMQANSSPNFTLAAAAASLTIDTSLAAYTGTVSVDESLAEDYDLQETAIATGTIYALVSKTPADPWAPSAETDEAASNKVVEIFGDGSDVANHVTTLAQYEALVTYIKSVTSQSEVPTDLTADQKTWMWKSFILGADPLFVAEPEVEITSLTADSTAGVWKFTVQVTDGTEVSPAVHEVVADKVKALVKTRTSLTSGSWGAPATEDISATQLLGGNTIEVTIDFGDGTSGFMKVSE